MRHYILIVEDESDIAESLRYNFQREGFKTNIAESGEKGLRLALDEKRPPSLILLDLMLPGEDGLSLCRTIRSTSNIPIIMVTANCPDKIV